ncbi:MAG: PQQ-like beta-propeller repeat protein [Paenibacillus sp.]|uniref:PQQ-binding-like beta-propeller repeat protein n=1 Tax=Paenibacillus sp. TaxID=58172 RepID=UPI0025E76EBA|nr:PQQ-binding-like beta-propeller repeat protein [Paenibacillus sp.]MBR2563742.1 PQQ-like beta-propeller repeat protein [Paenibacillus sp.]
MRFKKSISLLTGFTIALTLLGGTSHAATPNFEQGSGYSIGGYDLEAVQPTNFNWTRKSRFDAIDGNFIEKWSILGTNGGYPAVISKDGTIYTSSSGINATSPQGSPLWTFKDATNQPVIGSDGLIYATGGNTFYAINPDGTLNWKITFNGSVREFAIDNGNVAYLGSNSGNLYAINLTTQKLEWTYALKDSYNSHPTVSSDGTIYVQHSNSGLRLSAINPSGTLKWSKQLNQVSGNQNPLRRGSPLIDKDGNIYVMSTGDDSTIYSVSSAGDLNWTLKLDRTASGLILDEKRNIIYAGTSVLTAISPDGTVKWESDKLSALPSSIILDSSGMIYLSNGVHGVSLITPEGKILSTFNLGTTEYISIAENGDLVITGAGVRVITGTNDLHESDFPIGTETPTDPEDPTDPEYPNPETPDPGSPNPVGDRAIFVLTLSNGTVKEYDLSMDEVQRFIRWYETRAVGGPITFAINKHSNNIGPFKQRQDYIIYDKIITFEVNEY